MLTIAAVPKQFTGVHATHQRNAILSWQALPCEKTILLFGAEPGTREMAEAINAVSIDNISRDSFGTPLLSSVLNTVNNMVRDGVIVYVNADIILTSDIVRAIDMVREQFENFLMIARRWNIDFEEPIDFGSDWEREIKNQVHLLGTLIEPQGIDVFAFAHGQFANVPPFAIGRSYWDNWMVAHSRASGYPVVDATPSVMTIHQNHDYTGFASMQEIRRSPQGRRNFYLMGDSYIYLGTANDATHRLENDAIVATNTKSVSVIIPHKGHLWHLRTCLRSLTHQSYPRSFIEIIVVNNDPLADIGAIAQEFSFVKICNEFTLGPAAARNTGASCAIGDLLAFTDSDCAPTPEWIAESVAALEAISVDCVIAGAVQRRFKHRPRKIVEAFDAVTFLQQDRLVASYGACVTANMFVSREQFWRVGGFDESFDEAAGEDWEWSRRAGQRGLAVVYASKAIVLHPAITQWKDLKRKVQRIVRGNARRWMSLHATQAPDQAELDAVGPPTLKKLWRRVVRLKFDARLSIRERLGAIGIQLLLWPWTRLEWRRATRHLEKREK